MNRRQFIQSSASAVLTSRLFADLQANRLDDAAAVLASAVRDTTVESAAIYVQQRQQVFAKSFGKAKSVNSMFLLGSISKPIALAAVMTLFERGEFKLDDHVQKYLPKFTGMGREKVTMRHLMTHVSGLPDQLPENNELRRQHATLSQFSERVYQTPLSFAPGSQYQYSSMAILLASQVAQVIHGIDPLEFVDRSVFQPLKMKFSAIGLGRFSLEEMIPCQTEHAAPEAGAGDPTAKSWDWNSPYWRKLGAPWGGVHSSAGDVATFLSEFLLSKGTLFRPETARLFIQNQNGPGLTPRGLGFHVGAAAGSPGCSEKTFGHTGSTGTIAWADPASETVCVILTSLPGRAVKPHPRDVAAAKVAAAGQ